MHIYMHLIKLTLYQYLFNFIYVFENKMKKNTVSLAYPKEMQLPSIYPRTQ
jgi:hypothetical protein